MQFSAVNMVKSDNEAAVAQRKLPIPDHPPTMLVGRAVKTSGPEVVSSH